MKVMKMFRIYLADDYGRPVYFIGDIFKASDEKEARAKAAKYYNNKDIASTGFYGAKQVTQDELDERVKYLQNEIQELRTILG